MNVEKILFDNLKLIGQIIENPHNNNIKFSKPTYTKDKGDMS